jgi:hypothetical protein
MKFVIACILSATVISTESEKMAFVFEVVRHGARAPLQTDFAAGFPVANGELTP